MKTNLNKTFKAVIFDLDGLLVDSERLYWRANIQAAQELKTPIPRDAYLEIVGASPEKVTEFYHDFFADASLKDKFISRTNELFSLWLAEGQLHLKKGVLQFLQKLKKDQKKCIIASSNTKEVIEQILQKFHIENYFDFFICYDDVKQARLQAKPAPDIYLDAVKRLDMQCDELIVFEDTGIGVEAAQKAGLRCVMIPDLKPATIQDKKLAYLICNNFLEFSKNNY